MNFVSSTFTQFAATVTLVAVPLIFSVPAFALEGPEINEVARQTSVHILISDSDGESAGWGSGFVVSRNGDKYYVATNQHVVDGGYSFSLRMEDGEYITTESTKVFRGLDLAVIEFESNRNYPVAALAPSLLVGQDIFVSGWPAPDPNTRQIVRQFMYGRVSADFDQAFNGGYEISYSAPTETGMSGGQVLDSSGRVVAIHGMGGSVSQGAVAQRLGSTPDDPAVIAIANGTKSGLNYGIPISTFINQAAANGIYLNLDVSTEPVQPLGAPIANASDAAPSASNDTVKIEESLNTINGVIDTIDRGAGVLCGIFGC